MASGEQRRDGGWFNGSKCAQRVCGVHMLAFACGALNGAVKLVLDGFEIVASRSNAGKLGEHYRGGDLW